MYERGRDSRAGSQTGDGLSESGNFSWLTVMGNVEYGLRMKGGR